MLVKLVNLTSLSNAPVCVLFITTSSWRHVSQFKLITINVIWDRVIVFLCFMFLLWTKIQSRTNFKNQIYIMCALWNYYTHSHARMLTAAELQQLRSMRCGWMVKTLDCRSECCAFESGCIHLNLIFFPKHSQFNLLQLF